MGSSGIFLRAPSFSRLSPLPSRVAARDYRANINDLRKGEYCAMPDHPLTVPEILAAATLATPRTRSILARCRQRNALLRLRAVVRMIAILRRSNARRNQTVLHEPIQYDVGFGLTTGPHETCSSLPRRSTGRRQASKLHDAAFGSSWSTAVRHQTIVQLRPWSSAVDNLVTVMP
jgi:hypothetical protein